jgi:hypothetical protein
MTKIGAGITGVGTCLIALGVWASVDVDAQGRGFGRGGAPRSPGTVERVTVHGASLEGNLEGDSPDRAVTIYLPPSYAVDAERRFPVV